MIARLPVEAVSPRRKRIALVIAGLADALQLGLFPVFVEGAVSIPDDALDAVVSVLLLVTLGWRWRLAAALTLELVPGVSLFPTWSAFVMTLPSAAPAPLPPAAPTAATTAPAPHPSAAPR